MATRSEAKSSLTVTKPAANDRSGGIDMHAMVKQLQDDKMRHEDSIKDLTLRELREKVSSSPVTD